MSELLDIYAKLTLDTEGYEEGMDNAEQRAHKSTIGSALKNIGKAAMAGVTAAAAGIGAITKQAIDGFADYEQLAGGVETLFGDSATKVMENASKAFSTAGMSMNDYMETSIQSAAALINSVGGDQEAAAQLMDMSITDMADNVNKMGTTMEAVQNAYRGFSRGNFTMLDNLALGFAGTKEGMQELLDKAQEISGVEYDISSYADIVEAIHVVQDEMGITGTTAKEANETISGSLSSMKSAFDNLVTGLARNDADIGGLIDNLIASAETFLGNVLPVAERAISAIGSLIADVAPVLAQKAVDIITEVLPDLISAAGSLVSGIVTGIINNLDQIIDAVFQIVELIVDSLSGANIQKILEAGFKIVSMLAQGFLSNISVVIEAVKDIILDIVEYLSGDGLQEMLQMGIDLIMSIAEGFIENVYTVIEAVQQIIEAVVEFLSGDGLMNMLEMGIQLIMSLAEGLIQNLPAVLSAIMSILYAILDFYTSDGYQEMLASGIQMIFGLANGLIQNLPAVISAIVQVLAELVAYILSHLPEFIELGIELIGQLIVGLLEAIPAILAALPQIFESIINAFKNVDWASVGQNIIDGIKEGVVNTASRLWQAVKDAASGALEAIKDFLGIASPSVVMRREVGYMVGEGMALGITDSEKDVVESAESLSDAATESVNVGSGVDFTSGSGAAVAEDMRGTVGQLVEALESIGIYLDTGLLVGGITSDLDESMGQLVLNNKRYN